MGGRGRGTTNGGEPGKWYFPIREVNWDVDDEDYENLRGERGTPGTVGEKGQYGQRGRNGTIRYNGQYVVPRNGMTDWTEDDRYNCYPLSGV